MIRNNYILILFFLFLSNSGFSQGYTTKAFECYQAQDFECSQVWIDSAIISDERFNSQTWQLRGIIYRKLETPETIEYREIAIESFLQARTVDTTGAYKEKIDDYIYKTIVRYYNDAVTFLESNELQKSEDSYTTYKSKYIKYVDSKFNFDQTDIDYYNALGSEYLKRLSTMVGDEREKSSAKAIGAFEAVLEIDPNNYQANFNIGIIYYNDGADLVMNMDPINTTIEELTSNLEKSEEMFNKALPRLTKAYELNPSSKEAVEGLAGSYYGLNDDENYNKYQKILDELKLPDLLTEYNKNPQNKSVLKELVRIYSTTVKNDEEYNKYKAELDKMEE